MCSTLLLLWFYLASFNWILCEELFYDNMGSLQNWIANNAGIADAWYTFSWCSNDACAWIGSNVDLSGGTAWIETTVSTIDYHLIQLQYSIYPVLDSAEYCRVLYSVNRVNYTTLNIYDKSMNGAWSIMRTSTDDLNTDADNVSKLRIKFELIASGGNDFCAINEVYLYGEQIPTLHPTKSPTNKPSESTTEPTNAPSKAPTNEPLESATKNSYDTTNDDGVKDQHDSQSSDSSIVPVIIVGVLVGALIVGLIILMWNTKRSNMKLEVPNDPPHNQIQQPGFVKEMKEQFEMKKMDEAKEANNKKEVSVLPITVEGNQHIVPEEFVIASNTYDETEGAQVFANMTQTTNDTLQRNTNDTS